MGALWRGHTAVTGATQSNATRGKHVSTCHLHTSPSTSIIIYHSYDHPFHKPASTKTKSVPRPKILQFLPPSQVKSGMSLCLVPQSGFYGLQHAL